MADIKPEGPSVPSSEALQQRLDSMDKAISLLQEGVNRMPTPAIVNGKVDALKELTDTKILGLRELIDAKFEGNKTALDAALKTQKEGSDKIESNFTKQFENIVTNIQTLTKSFDDKITDVKDRFNTSQGSITGSASTWATVLSLVFAVASMIGILGFIIAQSAGS